MSLSLRFEQGVATHPGRVRPVNEDACVARAQAGLWAVADGMGGHSGGHWASRTIADALEEVDLGGTMDEAAAAIGDALQDANEAIFARSRADGRVIGSTVVVLLIREGRFATFWAGDSRAYRGRDDVFGLLTTDHSQVEKLIAQGLLDRAQAANHAMAHVLSRAVGVQPLLTTDRIDGDVAPGDTFLLCSDGLSGQVALSEMADVLRTSSPRAAATSLINLALDRGAPDNVTVAVVGCDATTLVTTG